MGSGSGPMGSALLGVEHEGDERQAGGGEEGEGDLLGHGGLLGRLSDGCHYSH